MPPISPSADEHRSEQLRKLTSLSRALTYTTAPAEVLRLAASRAAELLGAETALLMLADDEGLLQVRATHGVDSAALERFREPLDETLARRLQGLLGGGGEECFLGVPLVAGGAVTGLLAVMRREGNPCSEEEEWLLSAVADQVAVALENARLHDALRRDEEALARVAEDAEADEHGERALATLAHDLRSPLNTIDSYAELLEMEILGPVTDRQREALGRIRLSGRHLLAVLENVLEMTRLSADVVRVRAESVTAAAIMEEAALMTRPGATAKGQTLEVDPAPGWSVQADPDRLRQVLINLLDNARKYTPAGGRIRLRGVLREHDGRSWGTIAVSDNGPGIPPEKRQAVFRPYYRITGGGEDGAPEGTGLGLAISRELVRLMGGDIEVESEPGHGATFTVVLPLASEASGSGEETV